MKNKTMRRWTEFSSMSTWEVSCFEIPKTMIYSFMLQCVTDYNYSKIDSTILLNNVKKEW